MYILKIAGIVTLTKQTLDGRFGPYTAYIVSGEHYPLRASLNQMGFTWVPSQRIWAMSENKFTSSLIPQLRNLGVNTESVSKTHVPNVPQNPTTPQNPILPERETAKPTMKQWVTEDPKLTSWYGFPINKNILTYTDDFTINGEKKSLKITVDRYCKFTQEEGPYTKQVKSHDYKGTPRYIANVREKDVENTEKPLVIIKKMSAKKWGEYNEDELLEQFKKYVKSEIEKDESSGKYISHDDPSRILAWHYDFPKRQPDLFEALQLIKEKKYDREFTVKIDNAENPEYNGVYPVGFDIWGEIEKLDSLWAETKLDMPIAPSPKRLGLPMSLLNVHTEEELIDKMDKFLENENIKKNYLEYLKSFPFIQSQKENSQKHFETINKYLLDPASSTQQILSKIKEIGYVRPHKRQKQSVGLSSGGEIKWVIDHKKIKNDIYSNSLVNNTPEYFYVAVSYYIHREVDKIYSVTQAMLVDSVKQWTENMKRFGANISPVDAMRIIETVGMNIINTIYPNYGASQEEKQKKFYEDFNSGSYNNSKSKEQNNPSSSMGSNYLDQFKAMATEYGIDVTDAENNLKSIYRQLVSKVHPDKFLDPQQKIEMTKKFQDLQNIWEELLTIYKVAFTWYENYLIKTS